MPHTQKTYATQMLYIILYLGTRLNTFPYSLASNIIATTVCRFSAFSFIKHFGGFISRVLVLFWTEEKATEYTVWGMYTMHVNS